MAPLDEPARPLSPLGRHGSWDRIGTTAEPNLGRAIAAQLGSVYSLRNVPKSDVYGTIGTAVPRPTEAITWAPSLLGGFWNSCRRGSDNQAGRCGSSLFQVSDGHLESTRVVAAQGKKFSALRVQQPADALTQPIQVVLEA